MSSFWRFVRSAVLGGFFVVLPVVLIALILAETFQFALLVVSPIVEMLPAESLGGIEVASLVAVLLILLVCFVTGVTVASSIGARVVGAVERLTLRKVPGYDLLKSLTSSFSNTRARTRFAPVLVKTSTGVEEIGFVVEEHDTGDRIVFLPLAPTPSVGRVCVVPEARIRRLQASMGPVVGCVMQWGVGLEDVLRRPSS